MRSWTKQVVVVGLLATSLVGCQALKDALPTEPTEPSPAPSQAPIAIPVVMPPTPAPVLGGPAPNPTPATNPTPAPSNAPPPAASSCSLPPSNFPDAGCAMQSPAFLNKVDKAITLLTQQQPSIFDFNNDRCGNCYFIKNESAYFAGVIKNLSAVGLCAKFDGEEIAVKNTNSFNEQYDILLATGHIRRGNGTYRSTCSPSWF